jgi:predicted RNA-binding Zn-ribbon protein involved in translation (DUF1610 family)
MKEMKFQVLENDYFKGQHGIFTDSGIELNNGEVFSYNAVYNLHPCFRGPRWWQNGYGRSGTLLTESVGSFSDPLTSHYGLLGKVLPFAKFSDPRYSEILEYEISFYDQGEKGRTLRIKTKEKYYLTVQDKVHDLVGQKHKDRLETGYKGINLHKSKQQKECPMCGEQILMVAKKCKHCHEYLN